MRWRSRHHSAEALAQAEPRAVERVIGDVTFADAKGAYPVAAMQAIAARDGGFALDHLAIRPLGDALVWLERLPGVPRSTRACSSGR